MTDKITTFKLNWFDCGLHCAEDVIQEELVIYRNDNLLVLRELNGHDVVCSCEAIPIESEMVHMFFSFLQDACEEWESNYRIEVCDGSEWKVRMWHSSHKVTKVSGTIKYPPHGKEIEKYIRSFITDHKTLIDPKLFGCSE